MIDAGTITSIVIGIILPVLGGIFAIWWKIESRQDRKIDEGFQENEIAHDKLHQRISETKDELKDNLHDHHNKIRDKIEELIREVRNGRNKEK